MKIDSTTMTTNANYAANVVAPMLQIVPAPEDNPRAKARRAMIVGDRWAGKVTTVRVECRECGKRLKLNGRRNGRYYGGNWIKHRQRCPQIKMAIAKLPEVIICSDPPRSQFDTDDVHLCQLSRKSDRLYSATWKQEK